MSGRLLGVAFLLGLLVGPASLTRADDPFFTKCTAPSAVWPEVATEAFWGASLMMGTNDGSSAFQFQPSAAPASLRAGLIDPGLAEPIFPCTPPTGNARTPSQPIDQQPPIAGGGVHLPLEPDQSGAAQRPKAMGTVHGRLRQKGHPLVDCRVVLVPMHREGSSYGYDPDHEPLAATTDDDGDYSFEDVPAGAYKLTWLPRGTNQWIRRVAMKPDVVVHDGQAVTVKQILAATRTIN